MSVQCPKCGRLFTWDGTRCRNRFCRYGSDEVPEIDPATVGRERFLYEGGRPAVAAWVPGWYELDPPLEVGLTLWRSQDAVIAHGTIAGIRHQDLGEVRKVDTRGLDYTISLADGSELLVEAEETPGVCYQRRDIKDWRFIVSFESLSDPKPAEPSAPADGHR